jgi:hypothetical protein
MDIRETDCVNGKWMELAQRYAQLWGIELMVLNIRVPQCQSVITAGLKIF